MRCDCHHRLLVVALHHHNDVKAQIDIQQTRCHPVLPALDAEEKMRVVAPRLLRRHTANYGLRQNTNIAVHIHDSMQNATVPLKTSTPGHLTW